MPNENYILLERTELNASASSVTFANIPQTGYTDLKIVVSAMNTVGLAVTTLKFNGSSSGYTYKALRGSGSAAASFDQGTWGAGTYFQTGYNINGTTPNNNEIYIPNYTGSTNKSVSIDGVQEANSSTAYSFLVAGLWSNTAAITSITVAPDTDSFAANSTFSLYGIAALGTTPVIAPKASGGNIIDYDGTYWIHTFLTSGTFTPQTGLSCDVLVVAGGGGGGTGNPSPGGAGGGGGGGMKTSAGVTLNLSQNYTITIGAGGATEAIGGSSSIAGSGLTTISTTGGGRGAGQGVGINGGNGGSGGGGRPNSGTGGTGITGEGFGGGAGRPSAEGAAAGGGGASTVGETVIFLTNDGGDGGAGAASSISGSSVTYAGGGGGGVFRNGDTAGVGGAGGGGKGDGSNTPPVAGTVNRGGGGGGGGGTSSGGSNGAAGGSGIVIIRYPAA